MRITSHNSYGIMILFSLLSYFLFVHFDLLDTSDMSRIHKMVFVAFAKLCEISFNILVITLGYIFHM